MKKHKNIIIASITFIIVNLIGGSYITQVEKRYIVKYKSDMLEIAASYAYSIERQLSQSLSATYTLATLVQLYGKIDNFDILAETMIHRYDGIGSLQLAPKGIVKMIYPLSGNEKAIGHNLLKDPARRTEALKTIKSQKLTLAGPFKLIQGGGIAIIGRLPVFRDGDDKHKSFWGFTNVLIRLNDLLKATNISSMTDKGYRYKLFRMAPDSGKQVIISQSDEAPLDPLEVSFSFNVPNGEWTLSISHSDIFHIKNQFYTSIAITLIISLSFSFLVFSLLNRSDIIKSKSTELELSNQELTKTLAEVKTLRGIIPICSFCKKVRDDKGYWNQVEVYIRRRSHADFSHSVCPTCFKKHYPGEYNKHILKKKQILK